MLLQSFPRGFSGGPRYGGTGPFETPSEETLWRQRWEAFWLLLKCRWELNLSNGHSKRQIFQEGTRILGSAEHSRVSLVFLLLKARGGASGLAQWSTTYLEQSLKRSGLKLIFEDQFYQKLLGFSSTNDTKLKHNSGFHPGLGLLMC